MSDSIRTYEDFLNLFPERPRNKAGDGWLVICPAHNDHTPSLWITPADNPYFIADFKCQAGCSREAVLEAKNLTWADVRRNGRSSIRGDSNNGIPCQPVNGRAKQAQNRVDTPNANYVNGVNLATLAEAKHLPVDFLKSLGISDFKYNGQPSVKIPYYAGDGTERAVRFRLALTAAEGARFKWRKGDHALPYGLHRLAIIRKAGWVLIVEGESDCWTCWHYGIPALGAPGKSVWPMPWGEYIEGLEVYVWQEPEAEDFVLRVLKSAPSLRYITAPDGIKDISEAHIQGFDIPSWLEGLKAKAESGQALKARATNEGLARAYTEARRVIEADDPLELVQGAIRGLGYGGDLKPALITYLAVTSRLLEMRPGAMPDHLLLMGPPSAGKNYTLGRVLILLPVETYHVIDAGSPRVLIYDDADLQHKVLVFTEADSLPAGEDNPAASAIRNLLQDHHLHYVVTVRDPVTGDYTVREVSKPGPTVLITTSVRSLGAQLMTRLFTLEISDSREQISAALETQAALETEGVKPPDGALIAFQLYLQLRAPIKVRVPFTKELGAAMAKMAAAPRILRDFARLISLIKSTALIRHHQRQLNAEGQIIATLADYETVRDLVNEMYIDSSTGATSDIRKLVEAVIRLDASRTEGGRINNTTLAKELGTGVKQITRWARKAIKLGWLVNREQRKSYSADYAPGEPLPEVEGLPILEELTGLMGLTPDVSTVFEAKTEEVDRLTPLTDDDTPPCTTGPHESAIGLPVTEAIEVWRAAGAHAIHLGPGVNCLDLEKLLTRPDVPQEHLEAVRAWLQQHKGSNGQ